VYVGAAAPDQVKAFGAWRGRPMDFAVDFLAKESWDKIAQPDWWLSGWSSGRTSLVLSVPMLPDDPSTTLAVGATGAYNTYFTQLAQNMVARGYGKASIRLGWEFNGGWYRWAAAQDPAAFTAYWRQIVTTMRAVPGAEFRFDWTMNLGWNQLPADQAWPGDAYVDYVGVDAYDWKWNDSTATPAQRWAFLTEQSYGLTWVAGFAKAHGKRVTVPEWGLASTASQQGGGGGDNPTYVTNMRQWMTANQVAYEAYFTMDMSASERHDIELFPRAALTYRALFGPEKAPVVTPPATTPPAPKPTPSVPAPAPTTTPGPTPTAVPSPVTKVVRLFRPFLGHRPAITDRPTTAVTAQAATGISPVAGPTADDAIPTRVARWFTLLVQLLRG
jgi:hypothetical protein